MAFHEAPVTEAPSLGELLSEWRAACARALLLFSEYLTPAESYWPVDWVPSLLEELRPRRVQVIGYVRPQWEQIEDVYSQRVKIGLTSKTFDEYLDECLGRNPHRFDLRRRFGPWRAASGRHLAVRPFRADCLVGGDAVADFCTSRS